MISVLCGRAVVLPMLCVCKCVCVCEGGLCVCVCVCVVVVRARISLENISYELVTLRDL